ncbi:MAG: hypothetical protein HC880_05595 [Bacteroidia bacterium]|nr:hypothetical protein [Bacteroidia bacterium]
MNPTVPLANHDRVTLRIHNRGLGNLRIDDFVLADTVYWRILELNGLPYNRATMLPLNIGANKNANVTVEFKNVATVPAGARRERVKVLHSKMTIISNDDATPTKDVALHGLWQLKAEDVWEPNATEILDAFGLTIDIAFPLNNGQNKPGWDTIPSGDEVVARTFIRVDQTKPVYVRQLSAYHQCCNGGPAPIAYQTINPGDSVYVQGGSVMGGKKGGPQLFRHLQDDGQSILPRRLSGSVLIPAENEFSTDLPLT